MGAAMQKEEMRSEGAGEFLLSGCGALGDTENEAFLLVIILKRFHAAPANYKHREGVKRVSFVEG